MTSVVRLSVAGDNLTSMSELNRRESLVRASGGIIAVHDDTGTLARTRFDTFHDLGAGLVTIQVRPETRLLVWVAADLQSAPPPRPAMAPTPSGNSPTTSGTACCSTSRAPLGTRKAASGLRLEDASPR